MRVALVVERFEPHGGGVESVAWNVAGALAEAGEQVHVLARQAQPHPAVQWHPIRVPSFWQPLRVLAFSSAAARRAAEEGFDVVHSFSRTLHQDVFRAGGGSHADYLERSHQGWALRTRRVSPRHATLLAVERRVFSDPRQIIQCNSDMVRRELARRYAIPDQRMVVIHNGVDLERFHPERRESQGRRLRQELSPGATPVWLLAGSGFRRKGLDTALAALSQAPGELWVAGRDDPKPWAQQVERLGLAQRVRFLGPRADMEDLYAAADALVLPTRYDAFANVCLEAAAAGLPVLTSGANGAADLLAEAGAVISDPEDAPAFAKAMGNLADEALRQRLGTRGRKIAEAHSWDAHAQALRDLYRMLPA